jgi:hypothetical protein
MQHRDGLAVRERCNRQSEGNRQKRHPT